MKKSELKYLLGEVSEQFNSQEFIDLALASLMLDPISIKNLIIKVKEIPLEIRDAIYWNKFNMFLIGINDIQNNFAEAICLSDKLFGNENKKKENGMRLLSYIDKADSNMKIQYIINTTRAFLLNLIRDEDYFRIIKAVVDNLYEDLLYLSKIATSTDVVKGNIQVLALSQSGMLIQAGIDANESIEKQDYGITDFGRMVDRYAISLDNEERQKYYISHQTESIKFDSGIEPISDNEIRAMFNEKNE